MKASSSYRFHDTETRPSSGYPYGEIEKLVSLASLTSGNNATEEANRLETSGLPVNRPATMECQGEKPTVWGPTREYQCFCDVRSQGVEREICERTNEQDEFKRTTTWLAGEELGIAQ